MLRIDEDAHLGKNEDTLKLVARLQEDAHKEVENNQEQVDDKSNLDPNNQNFPSLHSEIKSNSNHKSSQN